MDDEERRKAASTTNKKTRHGWTPHTVLLFSPALGRFISLSNCLSSFLCSLVGEEGERGAEREGQREASCQGFFNFHHIQVSRLELVITWRAQEMARISFGKGGFDTMHDGGVGFEMNEDRKIKTSPKKRWVAKRISRYVTFPA